MRTRRTAPGSLERAEMQRETNRLEVRGVKTYFFLEEGILKAVDGVDLDVGHRETIGIIGESGSGKSVLARAIMRLVTPPGEVIGGSAVVRRKGGELVDTFALESDAPELRSIRGNEISMVFQEPMSAFSPVHRIGSQISEAVKLHKGVSEREAREMVVELLRRVGIANPGQRYDEYPYQLSGGMRQRAMIALALCCNPKVVLADEPTTALDVTIQAQILELMRELQQAEEMSIVYITHDLAVVSETADRVYVMYLGRVVESTTTRRLFSAPLHPYTRKLLQSIPHPGTRVDRLEVIEGTVPSPLDPPVQCPFFGRCPDGMSGVCDQAVPALVEHERGHFVRCFLHSAETEREDAWTRI